MGTYIHAPAHTCTTHLIYGGRKSRRGQSDKIVDGGIRNDAVHPILKNSTKANPNWFIQASFRESAYEQANLSHLSF